MIERDVLMSLLDYCPDTGVFRWRLRPSRKIASGSVAGTVMSHGYVRICIGRKFYYGHRVAWLFAHGEWPAEEIDHINGDPADNRIANLRPAARHKNAQNCGISRNNTSGVTGVSWDRREQKWAAYIMIARRKIALGNHADFDAAVQARRDAERRYFGEFARAA